MEKFLTQPNFVFQTQIDWKVYFYAKVLSRMTFKISNFNLVWNYDGNFVDFD